MKTDRSNPAAVRAFTLIELLVVCVVIAVLAVLIIGGVKTAMANMTSAACASNLKQIGAGIALYAADNDGCIPYGPRAGMMRSAATLYPSTGAPTSLISLERGDRVGLGLVLNYLKDPKVLFCPGADQKVDADVELKKVGRTQAQCSYFYRHGSNTALRDTAATSDSPPNVRLANLGENRYGKPVRALVIDAIYLAPGDLDSFNIKTRSNHQKRFVNVLFADGHVTRLQNDKGRFSVDASSYGDLHDSFSMILQVFEFADEVL